MLKTEAINLLGGTATEAAKRIGITPQAISGWPDELTPALRDRVQAALYRQKPCSPKKPKGWDGHERRGIAKQQPDETPQEPARSSAPAREPRRRGR